MESSTKDLTSRRWMGRLIRLGLISLAFVVVGIWVGRRAPGRSGKFSVERAPVADASLGAGDLRIYNRDSTVDLILRGNQILAGLSPKTVAKVQDEMQKSSAKDSAGFSGLIASTVKSAVGSAIGTHVSYPLTDIEDIRYEDGRLILQRPNRNETRLFGDTKVNGRQQGDQFAREDAERFIQAVRARKNSLPGH